MHIKQLSGTNHIWFAIDTKNTPMHVMMVSIYDPSTVESGKIALDSVKRYMSSMVSGLPLCQKLQPSPIKPDFPFWVEDRNFNIDNHVQQVSFRGSSTKRNMMNLFERIAEQPLDQARPLWQMTLVTGLGRIPGLPKDAFALVSKLHHSQFDGTSGMKLQARLHSASPDFAWSPAGTSREPGRDVPGKMLLQAIGNRYRWTNMSTRVAASMMPGLVKGAAKRILSRSKVKEGPEVPRTRFSNSIQTNERVYDSITWPLAEIKSIKNKVEGATVNDATLAIFAGAVRKYMEHHGELPETSLVIAMPRSEHKESNTESSGNQASAMRAAIGSDIVDPLDRLRFIRDNTRQAKEKATSRSGSPLDVVDVVPTYTLGKVFKAINYFKLVEKIPVPFSGMVLTNVPGPRVPLYFMGAKMLSNYGLGFLIDGMGLLCTVTSYCDELYLGVQSTPELLPDIEFFFECVADSYGECINA
ncbi:wax ester/triacylglycerol synthase family O-acyltransferase [Halioglobus maricola]|uniref:diacylglycerol O-acyltransferase n=1 Tax=Halioglobus maricola TaxID=2601894 RepID=A0A5P9NN53_9GAMM|nr:wax ester/triacylglycerol synthase family O-acyltransferase [Halioglobus maricola]QFU77192.1 wax ester/triacylglycerol synthase family O-acyltransferase [Halioglobus maricola]